MNIANLLKEGNVTLAISAADLKEFWLSLISEAQKSKECEVKDETFLSVEETAKELRVTKPTLWRWDKDGYLKPVKIGGRVFYRRSDIDKLLRGA